MHVRSEARSGGLESQREAGQAVTPTGRKPLAQSGVLLNNGVEKDRKSEKGRGRGCAVRCAPAYPGKAPVSFETEMTTKLGVLEISISPNYLKATVRINPGGDLEAVNEEALISRLTAQSIELTEDVQNAVRGLVARLKEGNPPTEDVVLAAGTPPVAGEDGYIQWNPQYDPTRQTELFFEEASRDKGVDHYARSSVISVSQGDVVCTVIPPTPGTPGRDICGREIPPQKGRRPPMNFRESLSRDDNNRVIAQIGGRLNVVGTHVWINPLLVIQRDVDFQVGNIDFDGDVVIRGNILDLFQVKSTQNVVVKGLIEAATIQCGGDLAVVGGITGKEKAVIEADGEVKARFIDNSKVTAGGKVYVQKEMVNSNILSEGSVITPGAITACNVEAATGLEAGAIGSRTGIRTQLTVGNTEKLLQTLTRLDKEIEKLEQRSAENRNRVEPAFNRQRPLPDFQKQYLTRLLRKVKEDLATLERLKAERARLQETVQAHRAATVQVRDIIHQGTSVHIGKAHATLRDTLRGPLRLLCQRSDHGHRIIASSDQGGVVTLESSD